MKISGNDQAISETMKKTKDSGKKIDKAPPKKKMSNSEIREKFEEHARVTIAPKKLATEQSQKLGDGFMNQEVKPLIAKNADIGENEEVSDKKDHLIKSDIAKNDPTDTNTQEKLKQVLALGAFSFNSREKEALSRILS